MQCENVEADGLRKKCTFDIEWIDLQNGSEKLIKKKKINNNVEKKMKYDRVLCSLQKLLDNFLHDSRFIFKIDGSKFLRWNQEMPVCVCVFVCKSGTSWCKKIRCDEEPH
jgi:hypothetical protein